jgi:hypothetical protein
MSWSGKFRGPTKRFPVIWRLSKAAARFCWLLFSRPSWSLCAHVYRAAMEGFGLAAMVRCHLRNDELQRMKFTTPRVCGDVGMGGGGSEVDEEQLRFFC